jgi:hypothetical protein
MALRHDGPSRGTAAFIARGGVGATAPALVYRFCIWKNSDFPKFSENDRISGRQFQKNLKSVAEDSGKTVDQLLRITKKHRGVTPLQKKRSPPSPPTYGTAEKNDRTE